MLEENRRPCPVCDHPTGDCTHGNHDGLRPLFNDWSDDPVPRPKPEVVVPEDLWEDVSGPKESSPRRRLVARAGQMVDVATARRLGIMPDDKQPTPPSDDKPDRRPGSPRDKAERPAAPRDRVEKK